MGKHEASIEKRSIAPLKPGEILVRVAYVGICATDLEILEERLGYYKTGMAKYPIVPGHESSGTVVSVGKKVSAIHEGDRVVVECIQGCGTCLECRADNAVGCAQRREVGVIGMDGGYATFLVTPAGYAHVVPREVTLAEAALAEPLAVVLKGLRRLSTSVPLREPARCAVIGAGAIGHLAARVLAARGHPVTVFDLEQARLALLDGIAETATALEGLDRFDWLVEASGNQAALAPLLQQSRTGATLLLLGLPYAQDNFSFETLVGFDKAVVGSVGSNGADFNEALATLAMLDTSAFRKATFPLAEFKKAWNAVRSREHIKVMLRVDESAV